MVKVFVSNVDSPIGHNLSLLLSSTIVGSRRSEEEPDEDAEAEADEANDGSAKPADAPPKEPYTVIGKMTPRGSGGRGVENVDKPGTVVDTGDRKRDAARKEAVKKFAVLGEKPQWVSEVLPHGDRTLLKQRLLECDVIVYDILSCLDEASWVVDMLADSADTFTKPKTFVGISTVMTWARTKPDPDDPDAPITEDEYRRRKPHPNFKQHVALEKTIVKYGKKSMLRTFVVAAGLVYHPGPSIFHRFLKSAWLNEPELTCYGDGNNTIPTIHLDDLCNITVEIVETLPETRYILAIDDGKSTLFEILKAISENLGTRKVKKVAKESALLDKDLSQQDYDMLMVNLRLDPGMVKEMTFEWKYETGLVETLPQLIQEYKDARGLTPLKIVVHGPPSSGKTFFSKRIAQHYEIHYLDVEEMVKDEVSKLERRVTNPTPASPDDEADNEADSDPDADRELLEELREAARANNGKYPDEHVINFVRERLKSMPCRNQGYVLDGYPGTVDEARELFKADTDDDVREDKAPTMDPVIGPDHVISLEATDEFIKERVMNLPERDVAGTQNSEEALLRRLEDFRTNNTDETTVLNFFDELEVHPLVIPIEQHNNADAEKIMEVVIGHVGKPHNYGPSAEQIEEMRRREEEEKVKATAAAEEDRVRREKEEAERHNKAVFEWNTRLDEIRKQEQEVLQAQSVPLRNYLMKYVMPTLTSGLIEVCKVRPDDPIDYLAEFLFKRNPGNA